MGGCSSQEDPEEQQPVSKQSRKAYNKYQSDLNQDNVILEQQQQLEYYELQKKKKSQKLEESNSPQKLFSSQGVVIGGNKANEEDPAVIQQRIAEAAERRMQLANNRGISQQAQIDLELKIKKQQELERYQMERNGQQYALKWN